MTINKALFGIIFYSVMSGLFSTLTIMSLVSHTNELGTPIAYMALAMFSLKRGFDGIGVIKEILRDDYVHKRVLHKPKFDISLKDMRINDYGVE